MDTMTEDELKKQVEYYAGLPYTIAVEQRNDQGNYYMARYIELPHFLMTGETPEEAVRDLEAEKREWFEFNLRQGNKIPRPLKSRKYSGRIIVRMPPGLHEHLACQAELQGISVNNLMVKAITRASGYEDTAVTGKKEN